MRPGPVGAVLLGTLTIGAGYGSALLPGATPGWAPWAMVAGTAIMLPALMALGAGRRSFRPLLLPLLGTFLLLLGGFGLALGLPPESPADPLWLGLPRRAALVLYGIGLLPALILPLAYAFTFDSAVLSPEDLERIRAAAGRRPQPE